MNRIAQLMVQSAPIANLEEDGEEIDEEDEDEYTYEEWDEEEEEEGEEMGEEFVDLGKNGEKGYEQKQTEEKCKDGNWNGEELIDESLWRLIQIPSDALERESAASLHRGNSIFWAPDPIEAFRLCQLLQDGDEMPTEKGAQVPVKMVEEEMDGIIGKELKERKEANGKKMVAWECLQRPSVFHLCMDMTQLSELNEPSVLECIRRRYHSHRLIHTYSGLFCVVVNPWKQLAGLYSPKMRSFYEQQSSAADLPPHVFSIAQSAFDGICSSAKASQAILITGESGAGKTENTKRIIEYLIDVSSRQNGTQQNCGPNNCAVDSTLVAAGIALEAFGNAQTVHNDNSSRLGKFIRIEFESGKGRLLSARIDCYLLEKSRVVSQNPGDRNFHIFYRLLANSRFLTSERAQRILHRISGIEPKAEQFRFLNQGMAGESVHAKFVDDLEGGRETETALDQLGFNGEEKGWLREMMLACTLIGQIRFGERAGMDLSYVEGIEELEAVAEMFQIRQSNKLMDALTQPSIRVGETLIRKTQPLKKTLASAQALAKCVYERIFGWLLAKCNGAIGAKGTTTMEGKDIASAGTFVGVLDMAGFEIMARNSFEQLCINYTNERLQQFFNEFMFVREQQEYCREGIRWEQQSYGRDLQPTIDLIEKPLGILSLLQEECIVPNGSEQSLLDKMVQRLSANNAKNGQQAVFARAKLSSRTQNSGHFTVAHYAGQVNYNVDGWLEKNRDSVDQSLLELLAQSEHPLLAKLFSTSPFMLHKIQQQQRKGSAMAQASISFVYREQLANLLDTLRQCHAHFVRCVVPNQQRIPFLLDGRLTMHQLRCNGVLEGIRICRRGYPNRIPFADFLSRYRLLSPNFDNANGDSHSSVQSFCHNLGIDPGRFQIGKSKVFCRAGLISELEAMRRTKLAHILTGFQAQIRFYWTQIQMRRRKEEWIALVSIQRAVRRQIQLKNWAWYRVWLKVRELIPLAHQKRRLAELETENRELHQKLEKEAAKLEWSQRELEEQKDRLERVEQQRVEERQNGEELKAELKRNEELLERMEKKWDEQHAKVMRLNGTLGEQARALERLEEEKNAAKRELTELRERHRMECLERESADEALAAAQEENVHFRSNADEMLAEMSRMRGEMDKKVEEMDELREKAREREEELADLNRALAECNDRLGEMQPQLHSERSARRKAEALVDDLGQELSRIGEELDKANAKRDAMKEQLRAREVQTRKLERKLEDKQVEMDDFLAELRRAHKKGQTDLQEQLDEWRRKSLKLETENAQLKCKLEAQNAMETATNSYRAGGGSGNRFGSCQALDRDQRDSSVDSDCGGAGGAYGLHRSLTRQNVQYPTGSLQRRRFNGGAGILGQSTMADSFEPGLHRSASGTTSSMGNLSSSTHSTSTSSSRRRTTANRAMITSLTATVDSGLLTRSPSSTSTVSGGQYLNMSQRVDAAERKLLEKEREIQNQRQEAQMAKRELEVYKQTLQESERNRDQLGKQVRQLNFELEKMGQRLKAEEEKTQTAEFETRKLATECGTIRQKLEEQREESEQEMAVEKKRNAEKSDQLAHEYELRLRQLGNSQRSQEQLLERLTDAESQLDKARVQLAHMERLQRTQSAIGETWEVQYRQAQQDLEGARDENAALKSRIRRQQKQIELLNQQSELSERVNELESRVGQVQNRFGGEKPPNGGMNRSEEASRKKNSLGEDENESKSEEEEEEVETDIQVLTFNCNYEN